MKEIFEPVTADSPLGQLIARFRDDGTFREDGINRLEKAVWDAHVDHVLVAMRDEHAQALTDLQTALDASESSRREEAAKHQARVDAVGGEGSYYELAVRLSNVQAENIRVRAELQEMRTLRQIDQRLLEAKGTEAAARQREAVQVGRWKDLFFYLWVTTMAVTAIVWTWRQL